MKKIVIRLAISFVLLCLWAVLTFLYAHKYINLSIFGEGYDKNHFTPFVSNELTAGDKVDASFTATDNNMGIVAVRFDTHGRVNSDTIIFRIKERGEKQWYYQNYYKVDQFQPEQLFTFGFPLITNSSGKQYIFEIQSVQGKPGNAVSISSVEPVFQIIYQPSKQHTLNIDARFKVLKYNFINLLTPHIILISLFYLLPFIFYTFRIFIFNKNVHKRSYIFILFILFLLVYCFVVDITSYSTLIVFILLSLILILAYKMESKIFFIFCLGYFLLSPLLYFLQLEYLAEDTSTIGYLFLWVGVIQRIYELNKYRKFDS